MLIANFFYGSIILKNNEKINTRNLNFVIKIISPKIEIKRFFEDENPEKIISELVQLSKPNNIEKTIFIFPEGALSNIYLEDLKNYSYIFSENYSDQHKIIMGINSTEDKKVFNSMVVLDSSLNILAKYNKNKLVPFGEFLPFENFFRKFGLKKITQGYSSFSSDVERKIIPDRGPHSTYEGKMAERRRGYIRKTEKWDKQVAAESESRNRRIRIGTIRKKYANEHPKYKQN